MDEKTLYEEAKEMGFIMAIDMDYHCSDLYLKVNKKSRELIAKHKENKTKMAETFKSSIDGSLWYDIPFGYPEYYIHGRFTSQG